MKDKKLSDLTVGDLNRMAGWILLGTALFFGAFALCLACC